MAPSISCGICGVGFCGNYLRTIEDPPGFYMGLLGHPQWAGGCGRFSGCMLAFRQDICTRQHYTSCGEVGTTEDAELMSRLNIPPKDRLSEYVQVVHGLRQHIQFIHIGTYSFWKYNDMKKMLRRRLNEAGYDHVCSLNFEHVVGPGCQYTRGRKASGKAVSTREMTGIDIAQCVILPSLTTGQRTLQPNDDDAIQPEGFEPQPWCLSTVCSRLHGFRPLIELMVEVTPRRTSQRSRSTSDLRSTSPYILKSVQCHPACIEVLKRVAIRRYGSFDINALGKWFWATERFKERFIRDEIVRQEQTLSNGWREPLTKKWITANPCYVPGLDRIVEKLRKRSKRDLRNNTDPNSRSSKTDFTCLPLELHISILDKVHVRTVAAILVVYPSLKDRINPYLRKRLNTESPHLWEFWSRRPYSIWTSKQMVQASLHVEAWLRPEGFPKIHGDFYQTTKTILSGHQRLMEEAFDDFDPKSLDAYVFTDDNNDNAGNDDDGNGNDTTEEARGNGSIDLAELVVEIDQATQRRELSGLGNRKRIWKDCEHIFNQIDKLDRLTDGDWAVYEEGYYERSKRAGRLSIEAMLYGFEWRR